MSLLSFSYPAADNYSLPHHLLRFTSIDGQDPSLTLPYDPSSPIEEQVKQSFETSLKNLGVEYIDAVVLHSPLKSWEVGLYFETRFRSPLPPARSPFMKSVIYLTNLCMLTFTTGHTQSLPYPFPVPLHKTSQTSWNIQLLRPFAFEMVDR